MVLDMIHGLTQTAWEALSLIEFEHNVVSFHFRFVYSSWIMFDSIQVEESIQNLFKIQKTQYDNLSLLILGLQRPLKNSPVQSLKIVSEFSSVIY